MAEYMILGEPVLTEYPEYRGTYRRPPIHIDEEREDSPANLAFLGHIEEAGEAGIVADLEAAKELVRVYAALAHPRRYEIVRLLRAKDRPAEGEEFLGYDLSLGDYYSLLSWRLEPLGHEDKDPRQAAVFTLILLAQRHFGPMLNEHSLFADRDTASFCLKCLMAMQVLYPNLWESDDCIDSFKVVGLSRVP